jgi:hypothetical protein
MSRKITKCGADLEKEGEKSTSWPQLQNLAAPRNTYIYGTFHIFVGNSTLGQKPKFA